MEMKFYICEHCGNIVAMVRDSGVPIVCCGQKMKRLIPNTTDGAKEKHVPVISRDGHVVTVSVGSTPHPMTEEHFIEWVAIQTKYGNQRKALLPGDEPKACFCIPADDDVVAVYAYCNLHGLWQA